MTFNWKQYCYTHKLISSATKEYAYNHYLKNNNPSTINNCSTSSIHEVFPPSLSQHKNLLFLCHTVPTPDIDSGSNRIIEILKIIVNLGYKVYYLTHDGQENNPKYIENLYQLGIEKVLVADKKNNKYCNNYIEELTLKEGVIFSAIIFEFYEMYCAYWDKVKYIIPNVKIIVDSVDVHWVRKLSNPNNTEHDIAKINIEKNQEKTAYINANVTFAVTEEDKKEILKECPEANVKILSNIHYLRKNNTDFYTKKRDLIFVGGDNHTPNTLAAKKAIEIFKTFIKQYPEFSDSRLHIVGKRTDKNILSFANDPNIVIHHQISQNSLEALYDTCLGALCLITWGSGIKGKVCEAIANNLLVITTTIGAAGLNLINDQDAFIVNEEAEQILCIKKIFEINYGEYKKITYNAFKKLDMVAGIDMARKVLEGTLLLKPIVLSIVAYNNAYLLQRCIESILYKTQYTNYKIHVTSNACSDETPKIMEKYINQYKFITYQYNVENKHFIQAHNEAMDLFPDSDIVLLNDDIEILSSCWLSDLYSAAYSAGYIGCAGGKTIYPNGTICEAGAEIYNNGEGCNLGRHKNAEDPQFNSIKYVGYVSGCMMYMRRDCITKFGSMDMRYYPCYYEDSDWQYNLHINGYKTIYTPKTIAIHREGSSCGTNIDDSSGFKRFMKINKIKFLEKYKNYDIESFN
jgi:GT2 family glycosyltransferase/glycosyltransferase involved in cell wall biosynthesis